MTEERLRVCVDYSPVANTRTGLGRYAEALGRHLLARDDVEASFYVATADPERVPEYAWPRMRTRWAWSARRWRASVLGAHLLGVRLDRRFAGVDLVHCTEHLLVPLRHVPAILTIHDVVYLTHPEWHLPWNHRFLSLAMPIFVRRARAIIAVSEFTRQEVVSLLQVPPEKVHAIHEGVDARFRPVREPERLAEVRVRYGIREPYVLFLGAIEPRKNLTLLLRAFAALLPEPGFRHQLVIAGGKGWLCDDVYATAAQLGLGDRCIFTGRVDDEDLPALYSGADVYAWPERYAGFGLPPLEAMACGAPVVCSNATSLPEVVGDAGLLLPPDDERPWVEALRRLAEDQALRRCLAEKGLERARRFTWEETARKTVELYRAVAARPQGS
ncbi:MAG: glycosyltransferase family 1 protein [Anaerolineae bacterium]|nr:glycosyltransferase family 1 protein [Anaerolineae bacterium]